MNPMFYSLLALAAVLAAAPANAVRRVLHINGQPIFGGSYYALPQYFVQGGGLILSGRDGKQCPLDIAQSPSEVKIGIPIKFSNWMLKVPFVPESQNFNIEMDVAGTVCAQSTYWWLDEDDYVTAGPKAEGVDEVSSKTFFQIKEINSGVYKFAFCPYKSFCVDVGTDVDDKGVRRLAIRGSPLEVVFVKSEEGSSKISPLCESEKKTT